jgi:hypothetical protein
LNLESTIYSAIVTFTVAPLGAPLNNVASPRTFPKTFTGLYARGWSPVLTGVGPKKNTLSGGNYRMGRAGDFSIS